MKGTIQEVNYILSRLFPACCKKSERILVVFACVAFGGGIAPARAADTSTFGTFRIGDQITSDLLEQIKALQTLLDQPISLGLLVRGGEGSPGTAGGTGKSGEKGTTGDQDPVVENGYNGLDRHFGMTGPPGSSGEQGTPGGYGAVDYADQRKDHVTNYEKAKTQKQNYNAKKSLSKKTHVVCKGKRLWLSCNPGEKINVTGAFWARDDSVTCFQSSHNNHSTRQQNLDNDYALKKVEGICNSRSARELYATRVFWHDITDLHVYKYLKIIYECVPKVYENIEIARKGIGK